MIIRHDREWRKFAHEWHLNLKRIPGLSFIEYEYAITRTAWAAWDRRSELAASAAEARAMYNAGLQHASEVIYQIHGKESAKAIQKLKI